NTGDVTLTGVTITDVNNSHATPPPPATINVGTLAPGAGVLITEGPFSVVTADCPLISGTTNVTGNNICPADTTCNSPTTAASPRVWLSQSAGGRLGVTTAHPPSFGHTETAPTNTFPRGKPPYKTQKPATAGPMLLPVTLAVSEMSGQSAVTTLNGPSVIRT